MKTSATIALCLFVLAISSSARSEYIDAKHYAILGVRLDERGVDSVTPVLGMPSFTKGVSGEAACYVGPDRTAIVFETTLVGFGYTVYSPERSSAVIERYDCLEVSALTRRISNGAGLGLGLSRRVVQRLLGPPKNSKPQKYIFEYSAKRKMTPAESERGVSTRYEGKELKETLYWYISSVLEVEFDDGGVSQFSIFTAETS